MRRLRDSALIAALGVCLLELALQGLPLPNPYAPAPGLLVHRYLPVWNTWGQRPPFVGEFVSGRLVGVSTTRVTYQVNRWGFLYDERLATRRSRDEIRIATVGGSVVECIALEESKRWPAVLRQALSAALDQRPVTVLNLGRSRQDTRSHLASVAQHAVKRDLDYIVFFLGGNDLFRLSMADAMTSTKAFITCGCEEAVPLWKRVAVATQTGRRAQRAYRAMVGSVDPMDGIGLSGSDPYFARALRYAQSLPTLVDPHMRIPEEMLSDYERNLRSLLGLATAHGIRAVFVTQPSLWGPQMTAAETGTDWFGAFERGGQTFRLPPAVLGQAMGQLNARLLNFCSSSGADCIDMAGTVPKSLDYYYDPMHFNENGARFVGEALAGALLRLGLADPVGTSVG